MSGADKILQVAVVTLGCAKNVADSDLLAGQLLANGIEVIPDPEEADAILVNTCAFLTSSQEESIEAILEMAHLRRKDPPARLVVVGCLAQRHGAALLDEIPEIDLLVGPGEVHSLAERLREGVWNGKSDASRIHLGGLDRVEEKWDRRVVSQYRHTAYVKISEGCDRSCSFCVIPQLRGPHRSRTREGIVREVEALVGAGVREINLVAQELTAYGIDLYSKPSLEDLLIELDRIDGLEWIRLLYTYPTNWSEGLFAAVRELQRVVPYVDIPIQHVDETILRAMRRPPFRKTSRLLDRLRAEIPDVALRTTLITGFPGEGEQEFEALLEYVAQVRFDALGVFPYSPEEGTDASQMPDRVDPDQAARRAEKVLALQNGVSLDLNRARIGRRVTVLLEEADPEGGWIGRHAGQAPEVDGVTRIRELEDVTLAPGRFVDAIITSAEAYDLEACPAAMKENG